jgi:hypothetical protein
MAGKLPQRSGSDPGPGRGRSTKPVVRSIADLDGRTQAARRARQLVEDIEADLGGAESLNTAQRELVKRAALAGALAEDLEVRWLQGEQIKVIAYARLISAQRRLCTTLGLDRRKMRDVTPKPDLTETILAEMEAAAT